MAAQVQQVDGRAFAAELDRAARLERSRFRVHRHILPGPGRAGTGELWQGAGARAVRVAAEPVAVPVADSGEQGAGGDPVGGLGEVVAALDALVGAGWQEVSGQGAHDALDHLEQAARRLAAVRAEVLSVVEGNGLWALQGSRTFAGWLRSRTGSSAGAASRQVRESRALRDHLPRTRQALAEGRIGVDHAGVLVREATRTAQLRAQLAEEEVGEEFLVEQAAVMDAGTFTRLVQAWAVAADPEAADRAWREADAKEELTLSPTTGGWQVRGWLDELSGQVVTTALAAHAGRKGADDERTPAQRRAAALVALAHQSLDAGRQGARARVRPHVTVTTSLELLRALAAATGSPVPPRRPDGQPHPPGAAFGAPAQASLSAPGGPRDQGAVVGANGPAGGRGATADGSGTPAGGLGTSVGGSHAADTPAPAATARTADTPRTPTDPAASGDDGDADGPPTEPFALSRAARAWLTAWQPGGDHVISTAIDHDLLRGIEPATLEDGTPVPPAALLARLVCESQLSRVVFGPESTVLDVGREQRIFPANQVRAIIARDRTCQYPDCDEPPGFGEIHHSLQWHRDHGPTSVEHGVLLCWHHHDWVHATAVTILRSTGRWYFYDRNGRLITARSDQ